MGKYSGAWLIMIGFKTESLKDVAPVVERLKEDYPQQGWNIMGSKFPIYDHILCGVADNRDDAHKIGLSVVRKWMPPHLNLLYWIKEKNLIYCNVEEPKEIKEDT